MPELTKTSRGIEAAAISLESLMEAYQAGSGDAGGELFMRVGPALYRFMAMQSGDRPHADDLLQDLWLRVHKARGTYRPGEPVLPWLYAIARFVKVDAFRKRRLQQLEEPLTDVFEAKAGGPGREVQPLQMEALLKALPESQREVVMMLKVSGLSLEEVAKATSSSVGSVKQKAHRAYEKLRYLLRNLETRSGSAV